MARPSEFADILGELGLRIQQARIAAGLTQEQAASDSGIDYKRWQRLEEGSVNPTVKTLHRVAVALDVPFWDLFAPVRRRNTSIPPRASGQMLRASARPVRGSGEIAASGKETVAPPSRKPKTRHE